MARKLLRAGLCVPSSKPHSSPGSQQQRFPPRPFPGGADAEAVQALLPPDRETPGPTKPPARHPEPAYADLAGLILRLAVCPLVHAQARFPRRTPGNRAQHLAPARSFQRVELRDEHLAPALNRLVAASTFRPDIACSTRS